MAQIPRPPKQGSVTTYVAKVAAGYTRILAGEMDADLDTIYGAWNGGADTVNLRDGCVTSAKLAADSVGPRELMDGALSTLQLADGAVTTPKIADGAVTDPKIVSVAWAKVTGVPSAPGTLPPSGPAGGDLAGSYPNPTIRDGAVTTAKLGPGAVTGAQLDAGAVDTPQLTIDAATQFYDGAGATVTLPFFMNSATETVISLFSAATPSRNGLIFGIGIFSGLLALGTPEKGFIGRIRAGGTPTGADGTVWATSQIRGDSTTASFPFQITCLTRNRGTAPGTGPFKLTAQLNPPGAAWIHDVQFVMFEFA